MLSLMQQLKAQQLSCIVEQHQYIYKQKEHGILPILRFLQEGKLKDASVADKVIGKAAAMMLVYGGAVHIDTIIISNPALDFLKEHKVSFTYEECVPNIRNRKGNGICPMEESVLHCEDMRKAYQILLAKVMHK